MAEGKPKRKRAPRASRDRVMARKVAKHMVMDNMTQAQAMRKAGYSERAIDQRPPKTLEAIRAEFNRVLDEYIPPEMVAQAMRDGLRATQTKDFLNPQTGEIVSGPDRPDHHASVKHAELYLKGKGLITRQSEVQVKHTVDVADRLARAWQRVGQPDVTSDVTCEPVSAESKEVSVKRLGPLTQDADAEGSESDEKAKLVSDDPPGHP